MTLGWYGGLLPAFMAVTLFCQMLSLFAKTPVGPYPASSQRYTLRWVANPTVPKTGGVEVVGISPVTLTAWEKSKRSLAEWQTVLSVHMEATDAPALFGDYHIRANILRFAPRFPLQPGVKYRAVFRPDHLPGGEAGDAPLAITFQLPKPPETATTRVTQVYPSGDALPQNLLKFYIHFSAPMSRGLAYDHIYLLNEAGKKLELPFIELAEELWDPTLTRLTLLFDPGRIKRGVRPLEEIGPALEDGKRYTLVIERAWKDGRGNPLQFTFRKTFRVTAPDRTTPDPARWRITPPKAGTRAPLAVTFPEPMDHALARRMIQVRNLSGSVVRGEVRVENGEQRWAFTPATPWQRGRHTLVIPTTIEDRAGNNIGKPFDVDLTRTNQSKVGASVQRHFMVR